MSWTVHTSLLLHGYLTRRHAAGVYLEVPQSRVVILAFLSYLNFTPSENQCIGVNGAHEPIANLSPRGSQRDLQSLSL